MVTIITNMASGATTTASKPKLPKAGAAIYITSTPPPAWPQTRTGGLWHYAGFFLASKITSCDVPVKKGQWVGVVGACGDSTIVHNSYAAAAGPFQSHVDGLATTLCGFGTQTNVMAAQGQGAYYADDAGKVSRVELYVTVSPAKLSGPTTAAPGTAAKFSLSATSDTGLPYQLGSSLGSGPIPLGSRQIGLGLDSLLVLSVSGALPAVFQNYAGVFSSYGYAYPELHIPNNPSLIGLRIHNAYVTLAPSATLGIVSISNAMSVQIQ